MMLLKKKNGLLNWLLVVLALLTSCVASVVEQDLERRIESVLESYCELENQEEGYYEYDLLEIDESNEYVEVYIIVSSLGIDRNGEITWGNKNIPMVLRFLDDEKYTFVEYDEADEGEMFVDSVRELFPAHLVDKIIYYNGDEMYERLEKKAKEAWSKQQ